MLRHSLETESARIRDARLPRLDLLCVRDPTAVHHGEEVLVFFVDHGREQIRVQARVSESSPEAILPRVGMVLVYLYRGGLELALGRDEPHEPLVEGALEEELEREHAEDGRHARQRVQPLPLEADGEDHEELHHDQAEEDAVDDDTPDPPARLDAGHEDVHQLAMRIDTRQLEIDRMRYTNASPHIYR